MPSNMDEKLVAELRRISVLLALSIAKDKSQREQIQLLARVGFQPKEIAEILDTTPNTVSVTLAKSRKSKRIIGKNEESDVEQLDETK